MKTLECNSNCNCSSMLKEYGVFVLRFILVRSVLNLFSGGLIFGPRIKCNIKYLKFEALLNVVLLSVLN